MDKRKLVNIIVKDLDELKILSEEVAESQSDASMIVDLAINKARLLIQEIELLRAYSGKQSSATVESEETSSEIEEEDELSETDYPEPELEILQFEEGEFAGESEFQGEELSEEEIEDDLEEDEEEDEDVEEELQEEEDEEVEDDDEEDVAEADTDKEEEGETTEEEWDEEENNDEEDDDESEEDEELEEEEEPIKNKVIERTELKVEPQAGIREIHIDDLDDDDIEPVRITPQTGQQAKPQMREIPKPEPVAEEKHEKVIVGEAFQKERSINDTIGENKSEPKLTNSPITSLRATIGLNDRFLFIREIFNNNTEKYNKVIETLDTLDTIQEAVEYLKANLTMQKNEASLRFVELLKRRFTK